MNLFYFTKHSAARIFAAVAVFSMVAGMMPMQAFAANTYTTDVTPSSVGFNSSTEIKFKVENDSSSDHEIKAFYIAFPAGFTASNISTSDNTFDISFNAGANRIESSDSPGGGPTENGLVPGDYAEVTATITHTGATGGDFSWTICAFRNNSFSPAGGAPFDPSSCLTETITVESAPVDMCPNIVDVQTTVPDGLIVDVNGDCVTPPPVDLCSNIADVQTSIPDGYYADGGACYPNPVDMCPNITDVQVTVPDGLIVDVNGDCVENGGGGNGPELCTLEIVSDTSAYVVEKDASALALSFVHPGWTAAVAGATWIWGDNPVVISPNDETQTFQNKFGFVGNVTAATLYVASDNSHVATVNTLAAGSDAAENNFQLATQDEYDVAGLIAQGNNEFAIAVTNKGPVTNPASNPAGVLYKLVIEGEVTSDADCSVPYREPAPEEDTYIIEGYVWHDDNQNEIWDGFALNDEEEEENNDAELPLGMWTVYITNGEGDDRSTSTDETGYYSFEVPAGTWTITEEVEAGWERTTQASFEVTVPEPEPEENVLDIVMNFLIPTAHAAVVDRFGFFNFGNDLEPEEVDSDDTRTTSTTGTRVNRASRPAPSVLGAATSAPAPLVLGEQVSIVPAGAPNAGGGGTAPVAVDLGQLAAVALLSRARRNG